jgi:hypothetical protein
MGDPPFWRLVFERRVTRYEEPRELATRNLYVLRLKTARALYGGWGRSTRTALTGPDALG